MRFALIATSITAVVVSPFIADAAGPQMSSDEFLSAVRCTAYEQVIQPDASLGSMKAHLNAEARRQPLETAQQARAEVSAITAQAVGVENAEEAAMMHQEQASACAGASMVAGAGSQRAA